MSNISIQALGQTIKTDEQPSDFETMVNELSQTKDTAECCETDDSDEILGDEEAVEMVLEQSIINETIRQMKQDQQRLEEIFNET